MAQETWTKGPWSFDATVSFSDRPDLPCVVDEHRLVIAQCWDDGHSAEECEANAHLIAAAPKLAEALAMFVNAVKPRRQDGHHEMPLFSATEIEIARAALAEAKGVRP